MVIAPARTATSAPNVHLCGNITWFPGYPGLIRLLAATHIGYPAAALVHLMDVLVPDAAHGLDSQ